MMRYGSFRTGSMVPVMGTKLTRLWLDYVERDRKVNHTASYIEIITQRQITLFPHQGGR